MSNRASEATEDQPAESLLAILNMVPVMVCWFDPAGRMTWVNRAMRDGLGWSLEEWRELDVLRQCYPDPADYARVAAFARQRGQVWRDFSTRTRDGRVLDTSWMNLPLPDGGGLGVGLDVTARKTAERKRAAQAWLLRRITSAVPDVIYVFDVVERRNVVVTGGSGDLLGVEPTEMDAMQTDWWTLMHPDDLAAQPTRLARCAALADDEVAESDFRMRHRDGTYRWFHTRTVVFRRDEAGAVREVLGVARDVTARKHAETQVHDYARRLRELSRRLLEVQEAERRHLARELHDEFGGSLTGLMMMLRADNASAGAQATLHDLIGRVRDLSLHLRPSMLDDFGLVAALAWLTRRLQEQSGLHVRLRSRGMQFRLAPAVETAAFRVVQEALTNVVRYAGVAEAEVRLACDGETLRVRVADRGTGFDPAAARRARRTGGLSGMRERVALLGGRFKIASRPGGGTRVSASIPLGKDAFPSDDFPSRAEDQPPD